MCAKCFHLRFFFFFHMTLLLLMSCLAFIFPFSGFFCCCFALFLLLFGKPLPSGSRHKHRETKSKARVPSDPSLLTSPSQLVLIAFFYGGRDSHRKCPPILRLSKEEGVAVQAAPTNPLGEHFRTPVFLFVSSRLAPSLAIFPKCTYSEYAPSLCALLLPSQVSCR